MLSLHVWGWPREFCLLVNLDRRSIWKWFLFPLFARIKPPAECLTALTHIGFFADIFLIFELRRKLGRIAWLRKRNRVEFFKIFWQHVFIFVLFKTGDAWPLSRPHSCPRSWMLLNFEWFFRTSVLSYLSQKTQHFFPTPERSIDAHMCFFLVFFLS